MLEEREVVVKSPLDPRIKTVLPLVQGLAEMFGPECEVVLHDINAVPHSIVAIENGQVTGRTVGDVPTDRISARCATRRRPGRAPLRLVQRRQDLKSRP